MPLPAVLRRHTSLRACVACFTLALVSGDGPAGPLHAAGTGDNFHLEHGEIAGASWQAAVPARWNKHLLLLAHGYRPESAPLVADLAPERAAYRALLAAGWIVATTSYRRNGLVLADAMADIEALRTMLAEKHGPPELVLLEGESMGGWIVTALVERAPERFHGAVAIGAALDLRESGTPGLTLNPQRPLLFLTNRSEIAGPRAYVEATVPREVPPALLRVDRDGHVNVNHAERLFALRALLAWIEAGAATLPRTPDGADFAEATQAPEPQPSRVVFDPDGRGFRTRVIAVDPIYGNVTLDAQPADFAALGLPRMAYAELVTSREASPADAEVRMYRLRYGRDFDDVPRGDWVAFIDAEGFTRLSRNFGDAARTAHLAVGSVVGLRRYAEAP